MTNGVWVVFLFDDENDPFVERIYDGRIDALEDAASSSNRVARFVEFGSNAYEAL